MEGVYFHGSTRVQVRGPREAGAEFLLISMLGNGNTMAAVVQQHTGEKINRWAVVICLIVCVNRVNPHWLITVNGVTIKSQSTCPSQKDFRTTLKNGI